MTEPSTPLGTVPDLLRERVEHSPNAIAFSFEDGDGWRDITWHEFSRRAQLLAAALRSRGMVSGEHVGILAPTGLGWELFHHAILRAGGVLVGLEPHDTAERLQWIVDHAEIRMLVVQDADLLGKLSKEQIAGYRLVVLLKGLAEPASVNNVLLWSELEAASGVVEALPAVAPDAYATLIYTSGTTGQPKGILYRHEQAVLAVRAITNAYPSFSVGSRFVCWLPLSNLFQRIMNLAAMKVGGRVFLVSNPLAVLKALPVAQPDVFIGVPRFYEKLHAGILEQIATKPAWLQCIINKSIEVGDRTARYRRNGTRVWCGLRILHGLVNRLVLGKLQRVMGGRVRFMVTGSAPTPVRQLEFFDALGLPLYEAYGMSENIVPMALNRPAEFRLGTVGRALPENTLTLADDRELLVKGPGVFAGYFRDARTDLFTSDGHYRTGDYASFDADGFLRLTGRKSEIIKTSTGRRISPLGIEARLQELPQIDRAMVVGSGRKCVVAIVTLNPASSSAQAIPDRDAVIEEVEKICGTLAEHERPAGFIVLTAPFSLENGDLTPNLKLKRNAIEARLAPQIERIYASIEHPTAQTPVWLW